MAYLSAAKLPYRDINLKVTNDAYTFTSPSAPPEARSLILDRPSGDVRLSEGALPTAKKATRVSSIAGILGTIQLRLGMLMEPFLTLDVSTLADSHQTNMLSS